MDRYHRDQTAFTEFYSEVQKLRGCRLGRKLYESSTTQSSTTASRLFKALDKLRVTLSDIREEHGYTGPHAAWNPYIEQNTWTPPQTPSPIPADESTKSELHNLRKLVQKRDQELEQAKIKLDEYREKLSDSDKTIEGVRCELASEYTLSKRFSQAADQYELLRKLKDQEMKERIGKKDQAGARHAEESQLKYMHQTGEVLLQASRYSEAERAFERVLEKRKEFYNDDRVKRPETREAQLNLCTALRSQKKRSKLEAAEELYLRGPRLAYLHSSPNEADATWILRNAFEIACVYAEQDFFEDAVKQLGKVWPLQERASSECKRYFKTEAVQLWRLLRERHATHHANEVLSITCQGQEGLPSEIPDEEKGIILMERGEFKKATTYLSRTWDAPSTNPTAKLKLGWSYAWSLCHINAFSDAKRVLETLLKLSKVSTSPSANEVKALLAYTQLSLKHHLEAERHAQAVFDTCGTLTLSKSHTFNHAGTLIKALIQSDAKDKYLQAHEIWKQIYADRRQIKTSANGKVLLKHFAGIGAELAETWKSSQLRRQVRMEKMTKCPEIARQAAEVRNLAA